MYPEHHGNLEHQVRRVSVTGTSDSPRWTLDGGGGVKTSQPSINRGPSSCAWPSLAGGQCNRGNPRSW